jgi:tetrahydromethanopterin S-methyltransferase subunit G
MSEDFDKYRAWAECLQAEFRKLQTTLQTIDNRLQFVESQCLGLADFSPANDEVLLKRLENLKR